MSTVSHSIFTDLMKKVEAKFRLLLHADCAVCIRLLKPPEGPQTAYLSDDLDQFILFTGFLEGRGIFTCQFFFFYSLNNVPTIDLRNVSCIFCRCYDADSVKPVSVQELLDLRSPKVSRIL